MNLNEDERELIEIYRKAKQDNDTNMIISLCVILSVLLEQQDLPQNGLLSGFSRGQYKRAIKAMRMAQAWALRESKPDVAANFDRSVQYIREHCLQRTAAA